MPRKIEQTLQDFIDDKRPISVALSEANRERVVILMNVDELSRSAVINKAISYYFAARVPDGKQPKVLYYGTN